MSEYSNLGMCVCGNNKKRWHDDLCSECSSKKQQEKRAIDLEIIASQDLETRLRNIEAYIYDDKNSIKRLL